MPRREQWGDGSDWTAPPSYCPVCLHRFDAFGHPLHNNRPKPGNYAVCIECASVLEITPRLTVALADPIKLAALRRADPALDQNLTTLVAAVRSIPLTTHNRDRAKHRN